MIQHQRLRRRLFILTATAAFTILIWTFLSDYPLEPSDSDYDSSGYRYCYRESDTTIIFIHLTNDSDQWPPLEMCAFKSAALLNKDSGVCVLTKYPMRENKYLRAVPNIEVALLDTDSVFKHTPMERWYESGVMNESSDQYYVCHLSDSLRYAYLYKYGGRYVDTDFITLRSFRGLKNVLGRTTSWEVNGAILFFPKRHPLITHLATKLPSVYKPGNWHCTGPKLITNTDRARVVSKSTYKVMKPHDFYPIRYNEFTLPFEPQKAAEVLKRIRGAYAMHFFRQMFAWNKEYHWKNTSVNIMHLEPGSFFHKFYNKVCLMDDVRSIGN